MFRWLVYLKDFAVLCADILTVWDFISSLGIERYFPLWESPWFRAIVSIGLIFWTARIVFKWGSQIGAGEVPAPLSKARAAYENIRSRPFIWKMHIGWARNADEVPYVLGVYLEGKNKGKSAVQLSGACLKFVRSGEKVPLCIDTRSSNWVLLEQAKDIPSGATATLRWLTFDPSSRTDGAREGVPGNLFLKERGAFDFVIMVNGRRFERRYSDKEVRDLVIPKDQADAPYVY